MAIGDTGTWTDTRDGQVYPWRVMEDGVKWMTKNYNFKTPDSIYYDNNPDNAEYGRLYHYQNNQQFEFYVGDTTYATTLIAVDDKNIRAEIDGMQHAFSIAQNDNDYFVHNENIGNGALTQKERFPVKEAEKVAGGYETPMPSQIIKVLVKEGQAVKSGEGLVILSSMKMENTIETVEDGVVEAVYAKEGSNVEAGFLLLKLETKSEA